MNKKILFLLPFLAAGLIGQQVNANTDSFRVSYQYDSHGRADRSHNGHRSYDKHRRHADKAHPGRHQGYDKHRKHYNKAHLRNHLRRHWQHKLRHQKRRLLNRHFYNDWRPFQHSPRYRPYYGYQRYNYGH